MDFNINDLLRNVGLSAVSAIPVGGGILSYLLDKKIPEQIVLRYSSFLKEFEKDILSLNRKIDYEQFETPQFYSMFVKVLNEVIESHIEDKRVIFKNMLLNTLNNEWNYDKNDFFYLLTREFSTDELKYLLLYYLRIPEKSKENDSAIVVRIMMRKLPEQKDYILSMVSKMNRLGLVTGKALTKFGKEYCEFVFQPLQADDWIKHLKYDHL